MSLSRWLTVILVITFAAACKPYDNWSGGTAVVVVDLNAVAKALGRDELIKQDVEAAELQLRDQLLKIAADLEKQVKAEQEKLGSHAKEEDVQRMEQLMLQAQQTFKGQQFAAQQKAAQYREQLLQAFREEVKEVAEPVARSRGAKLVKFVGADVLWFDPGIDITAQVIGALRAESDAAAGK